MEKLIELLNEHAHTRKYNNAEIVERVEHTKWNLYWRYRENTWSYMIVISKEYWFIKWLVDNDKIDLNNSELSNFRNVYYGYENDKDTPYKTVLMLLSIQDNPIEFLVSILK